VCDDFAVSNQSIASITSIPLSVIDDYEQSEELTAEAKMEWASDRVTTRPEDSSKCLLGILNLHMPMIYGEGGEEARLRLLEQIEKRNTK
jgi:hypothetical protein